MPYTHLTNAELCNGLEMRNDLSQLEHELLDRLIRTQTALDEMEAEAVGFDIIPYEHAVVLV